MNSYVRPAVRAGATAVAAATGFMVLASTGQTPAGFVPASFGGPLGLFDASAVTAMTDVVSIGDGPADAKELAALLKAAGPLNGSASAPVQATFTPGAVPNTAELSVVPSTGPASAPTSKQSTTLKPVLDGQGKVDCSKALSCQTDPTTHVTTVTYPDGVVAIVQQINDMTLVAYKTVGEAIQDGIEALLPLPKSPMPLPAEVRAPAPAPAPVPVVAAPAPQTAVDPTPQVDARPEPSQVAAGPVAPSAPTAPDISAATVRPQLTITNPPLDYGTDKTGSGGTATQPPTGTLDAVKDAVGSVVDAVTGAVGKAIGPSEVTSTTGSTSGSAKSDAGDGASRDSGN